jgi:hypothetical protein
MDIIKAVMMIINHQEYIISDVVKNLKKNSYLMKIMIQIKL